MDRKGWSRHYDGAYRPCGFALAMMKRSSENIRRENRIMDKFYLDYHWKYCKALNITPLTKTEWFFEVWLILRQYIREEYGLLKNVPAHIMDKMKDRKQKGE